MRASSRNQQEGWATYNEAKDEDALKTRKTGVRWGGNKKRERQSYGPTWDRHAGEKTSLHLGRRYSSGPSWSAWSETR